MAVLVACEKSQVVTTALRKIDVEAYSCDIQKCSGGYAEWHFQQDVKLLLRQNWDMIIAFPPCTHLCSSGAKWFKQKRLDGRQQQGIDFFMQFANTDCQKVSIENPVGIISTIWRKPDQIIQPWQFGHGETKATCLWLSGLPRLIPTNIVDGREQKIWKMSPSTQRSDERSRTFLGIAEAMADQWGKLLTQKFI